MSKVDLDSQGALVFQTSDGHSIVRGGQPGQVLALDASGQLAWLDDTDTGGMTNPMTTQDDLIIGGTSGAPARLAKGADTKILTMVSGHAAWADPAADSDTVYMTNPMTTVNDIIIGDTSGAPKRVAVGAPGTVLTVGGDNVPVWAADTDTGGGGGLSYSATVLADTPLVYWRLNEPSGATAADLGSLALAGTYHSPTYSAPGAVIGDAAISGAASVGLVTANDGSLPMNNDPRSMECWFKTTVTADQGIMEYGHTDWTPKGFRLELSAGTVALVVLYGSCTWTAPQLTDGAWHHIIVTWNGTVPVLFIDGVLVPILLNGLIGFSFQTQSMGTPGLFVGGTTGLTFTGSIDEAAVYGAALTAAQALAHFEAGTVATTEQLQAQIDTLKTAQFSGDTAALADAALAAGDFTFWLDDTNGTVVFHIKAKQADGTVVNGTVALT